MRLRIRLLGPIVAIFVVMAASALAWSYQTSRADAIGDASREIEGATERRSRLFQDAIRERSDLVVLVAETKRVTDLESALVEHSVKKVLVTHNLASLMARYSASNFDHIYVFDKQGHDVISFENGKRIIDLSTPLAHSAEPFLSHFRNASQAASGKYLTTEQGEAHIVFGAPVRDQRGNLAGVVVAAVPLLGLTPFAREEANVGLLTLYNEHGEDTLARGQLREGIASLAAGVHVMDAEILAVQPVATLTSFDQSPTTLLAVSQMPMGEATAIATGDALRGGASLLAILVAVGAVAAWVVTRATQPIEGLGSTVSRIGKGDYAARADASGADELVALAQGVNGMAEQLAAREEQLHREAESRSRSERFATLGSLSAGVAHEVNNPLAFMRASTDISIESIDERLARSDLASEERALLDEIKGDLARNLAGIERIAKIVRSLGLLAKPQPARGAVCLASVVEATTSLSATRLRDLDGIEIDVPPEIVVQGCFDSIGQVLLNLLINAVDATPKAGGWVRIAAKREGDRVYLSVEDNGSGIPAEFREKLFTPFATTKASGTGLGLSISQRIMQEHGGSIRHEDREGGGSRFILEFQGASSPAPAVLQGPPLNASTRRP